MFLKDSYNWFLNVWNKIMLHRKDTMHELERHKKDGKNLGKGAKGEGIL